jgi:uncharacterized protein DUF1707
VSYFEPHGDYNYKPEQELQAYTDRTTRAGREDRDRYIDHLSNMYASEYITREEFQERSGKAVSARHVSDLKALVSDLKPLPAQKQSVAVRKPRPPISFRADDHPCLYSFLGFLASLTVMIWPSHNAAQAYHGFGNAPVWYGLLAVGGGALAVICLCIFVVFAMDA